MERIGHYKIVSELGRGGMGVVYKAHEESLNRFVAIKVLGEHLEEDAEYVERFVREAQSAAALSHPNIVQIYTISEDEGHHYFAMEYVQGTSVQRLIQTKGKLSPADSARLILQAAAGLQDAHSQGVIHRDIKPANLMITERGLVKIADFGLALMGGAASRLTATGMLMGTPGYLSPEQCLDQSPDHRTDIYSLGVTFFELVTGTMPFRADSPLALLKLIVEVEPPEIKELNPEVDDDLRVIIERMLAKDRDDRYADCTEIIADVQGWLEARGEPLQSTAGGVAAGTAAGVMSPPSPQVTEEQINTDPTVVVESGSTPPPAPPGPSPPTVVEERATSPAPQATAPATQPQTAGGKPRVGLIVAAVAVLMVAAIGVAALLTVKSGVLDALTLWDEPEVAEIIDPEEVVNESNTDDQSSTEATNTGTTDDAAESASGQSAENGEISAAPPEPAPPENRTETSSAVASRTAADSESSPAGDTIETVGGSHGSGSATASSPPQIRAVPPTATVVLAVGEQLLAVEAEEYVKERLSSAGVKIIEVTSIPGLEGLVNTEARPGPEQLRDILQPYARYFVPLRVEYLGDRAVYYMGQSDVVYQARVNMSLVDLVTGRPVIKSKMVKLEYTQLNAAEVVARDLRKPTTNLVKNLPRK